jgi:anti-anti-sigma factor
MDDSFRQPSRPSIEVEAVSAWVSVATLRGEHDLGSKAEVAGGLARACDHAYVIVDMSECSFIDSTIISVLLSAHRKQLERDGRLELVIPSEAEAIRRIASLASLGALLTIHETRAAALASVQPEE